MFSQPSREQRLICKLQFINQESEDKALNSYPDLPSDFIGIWPVELKCVIAGSYLGRCMTINYMSSIFNLCGTYCTVNFLCKLPAKLLYFFVHPTVCYFEYNILHTWDQVKWMPVEHIHHLIIFNREKRQRVGNNSFYQVFYLDLQFVSLLGALKMHANSLHN